MSKRLLIAIIVFTIFFAGLIITGLLSLAGGYNGRGLGAGFGRTTPRVALIYVEGTIVGDSNGASGFLSGVSASSIEISDRLLKAGEESGVKAVLLRVNSPGGSAAASQEIFQAIREVRKKKPVVVSMGDLAASGGYYISSAADFIYANPATLTGSIGVIFDSLEVSALLEKIGVTPQTLKAGEYKDIGSLYRKMTESERKLLQEMLDDVHAQFINAVAEGRKMDIPKVRELATGIVMTGEQAKEKGLVDELGGLEDAKKKARELAKLPEDAPVVPYEKKPSIFDIFQMFGGESGASFANELARITELDRPDDSIRTLARRLFLSDPGFSIH